MSEEAIEATETGLVFKGHVSFDEWARKGQQMDQLTHLFTKRLRWWVGDWILYGEAHFGKDEKYAQALTEGLHRIGTLYNAVYVCRAIPPQKRIPDLSFEHHYKVASLPPERQETLLQKAVEHHWSTRQLKAAVDGEEVPSVNPIRLRNEPKWVHRFEPWYLENEEALAKVDQRSMCQAVWDEARRHK